MKPFSDRDLLIIGFGLAFGGVIGYLIGTVLHP